MRLYEFAPGEEKNSYIFPTKFGWLYSISFRNSADYFGRNEILFNNSLVFEICISRSLDRPDLLAKGIDTSVKETINVILHHHLEGQGHLPLYIFICYSADEKEAARMRLFIKWYESFESNDWELYSYELVDAGNIIYYGLFVNSRHPFSMTIPESFEDFVRQEKDTWKDLFRTR